MNSKLTNKRLKAIVRNFGLAAIHKNLCLEVDKSLIRFIEIEKSWGNMNGNEIEEASLCIGFRLLRITKPYTENLHENSEDLLSNFIRSNVSATSSANIAGRSIGKGIGVCGRNVGMLANSTIYIIGNIFTQLDVPYTRVGRLEGIHDMSNKVDQPLPS